MDRRALLAAGAAVAVAGGAGWYFTRPSTDSIGIATSGERLLAQGNEFGVVEMTMGDPEAPIEVIEYASFTCPHCASFHANQFKELKANYIDTGKVHFGYREVYFDQPGLWASMVARCGDGLRFFAIAELIYERQRLWTSSGDPATISEELQKIGKIAGLDDATLDACMSNADMAQNLNSWFQTNSERDAISSTPSFLIDGQKFGNMNYEEFARTLDAKLSA